MFGELWKGLGGAFDKHWLLHDFGPALLFWGAGLWVWTQIHGMSASLVLWEAYAERTQVFLSAAAFLVVVLTALLLGAFEGHILRFYEGYWPWRQKRVEKRANELAQKQARRQKLRLGLVTGEITPQERSELGLLTAHLRHRPVAPERSMPTALGDILRTAEDYPRRRYGLDAIILWPRLYPQLSEPLREALGATQAQLNLALRLATLSAVYGVIWTIVVLVSREWLVLTWTVPAFFLAWLLWRSAHPAAVSYAGLFRSAFDLHRFDVYDAMHWPKPASPTKEVTHGQQLVMFLTDHVIPEGLAYTDAESNRVDTTEATAAARPTSIWDCIFGARHRE